jgi:hypothetical protein
VSIVVKPFEPWYHKKEKDMDVWKKALTVIIEMPAFTVNPDISNLVPAMVTQIGW